MTGEIRDKEENPGKERPMVIKYSSVPMKFGDTYKHI
jgi:hypothetical protein